MKNSMMVLLAVTVIAGCGDGSSKISQSAAPAPPMASRMAAYGLMDKARSPQEKTAANAYLAYEHSVSVISDEAGVKALYEKLIAACNAAENNACLVLNSNLQTERRAYANLRMRAKPETVKALTAIAGLGGELSSQGTTVEDLSGPIVDNNRRLEMQKQYQKRLMELERKATGDVDSLIKVSKELAQVQSEIEAATGEAARLAQRINTDILNIAISTREGRAFWTPIADALKGFSGSVASGISTFIIVVAYLLPWLIALIVFGFVVRKLWRRRKG